MLWLPPAETRLPLSHIISACFSKNDNFEKALCNYLGVDQCVLGNSGRALLTLLLQALREKDNSRRSEVLMPGYTCYSVAASVVKAGLKIRVYDLDPKTFNPDQDSIRKALNPNTLAVVSQHLFGIPSDMEQLKMLAKENGSHVVEDAAQALGGELKGRPLGTLGDFGFYSFGRGKPLPLGGGGALVGEDLSVLRTIKPKEDGKGYGALAKTFMTQFLSSPFLYRIPEMLPLGLGETIFDPKFNISCIEDKMAVLGVKNLHGLNRLNEHRRRISNIYNTMLPETGQIKLNDGATAVYTRYPYLAWANEISTDLKRLGVRRMYPAAIVDDPDIRPHLNHGQTRTPGAFEIARRLITLPTHTGISEQLAREIAVTVKRHINSQNKKKR